MRTPDGWATDLPAACADYEAAIDAAGGSICSPGHRHRRPHRLQRTVVVAGLLTRVKTLTQETREDNARFFDDEVDAVPGHVLTQGIGTILRARHLVLLAWARTRLRPSPRLWKGRCGR